MAVLHLLRSTAHVGEPLHVLCDSQYVINSLTKWLPGWKRKGWKKGDGKPVLNVELMKALDEALRGRAVTFEWVKGHSGHDLNEAADQRARAAATAYQQGREPDRGPGYPGGDRPAAEEELVPSRAPLGADQPDLFSDLDGPGETVEAPRPVPGSASPRQKAALVRASRSLFDAPALAPLHPEFLCHAEGAESTALPWPGAVAGELRTADALGGDAALVRAVVGEALVALVWVQLPAGWHLRFAAVS